MAIFFLLLLSFFLYSVFGLSFLTANASRAMPTTSENMRVPAKTQNVPNQWTRVNGFSKYLNSSKNQSYKYTQPLKTMLFLSFSPYTEE